MPPPHPLVEKLGAVWPPEAWQDVTVLLAISGGADSVALLDAMTRLKRGGEGRLCTAHFNHRLRGDESAADEALVVELCSTLGVHCEVGRAEAGRLAKGGGDSLEAAARNARYDFLQRTAARLGARYVVTAHTADDQAETILHRILRGTGIAGLSGMARTRALGPAATLIRPLLAFRRAELIAYLDDVRQPHRRDSSNDDPRFTRNRIRHELLPRLAADFNPGVVDALLRLGSLAGEVRTVVDQLVEHLAELCVARQGPGVVRIELGRLTGQPRYVIRELVIAVWRRQGWPMQSMGFAQWDLLSEMISARSETSRSPPQKQMFPGSVLAEIRGRLLLLERLSP